MRLSTRTILMAVILAVAMGAQTVKNEETETISFGDIEWMRPPTTVEFYNLDKLVVLIDLKTGNVEIAKDLDMNEASRLFWKVLQEAFPLPCEDEEPLHPKLSVCEKACPDGTTCGCVEPTIF